jgi:flagellar biosynthesis/type III secretory pathway M-ring protein FliF/YscJ
MDINLVFMMAFLLAIVVTAFIVAKGFRNRRLEQRKQDKQIEEKLDQIIEKMDQAPK